MATLKLAEVIEMRAPRAHDLAGVRLSKRQRELIEVGRRLERGAFEPSASLASAEETARWARAKGMASLENEELWLLGLDPRNRLMGEVMVARGGLHACAASARDILRHAIMLNVSAFVLVHNHPSGYPTPSREDVTFTAKVAEASVIVGLTLVDHLVIARDGYVSMLEAGLLA